MGHGSNLTLACGPAEQKVGRRRVASLLATAGGRGRDPVPQSVALTLPRPLARILEIRTTRTGYHSCVESTLTDAA
jgi:hypothetical protein